MTWIRFVAYLLVALALCWSAFLRDDLTATIAFSAILVVIAIFETAKR